MLSLVSFTCNLLKDIFHLHPTIQVLSLKSNWKRMLVVWDSVLCRWRERTAASSRMISWELSGSSQGSQLRRMGPLQLVTLSWLWMEGPQKASSSRWEALNDAACVQANVNRVFCRATHHGEYSGLLKIIPRAWTLIAQREQNLLTFNFPS